MRRSAAISALLLSASACAPGESAVDAGPGSATDDAASSAEMRRRMESLAPDLSTEHDNLVVFGENVGLPEPGAAAFLGESADKPAPGSGDVLENMYRESIVWADLQVREARP